MMADKNGSIELLTLAIYYPLLFFSIVFKVAKSQQSLNDIQVL